MNDKVIHRGPDDEGYFFEKNFAFGHRRLSIIDLSKAGHQPMQREHLTITYNGEIYNYIELKEELIGKGYSFHSATDTEVILAAYEEWGTGAFERLNGMWAFAIHDSVKNEIILCRDHFGIKPLYFTKTGHFFLAGSEIKQFTVFNDFIPVLNKKIAVNFLVNGLLNHSDETFFEGVNELRAGHYLTYNLSKHDFKITKWYDLDKSSIKVNDEYQQAVQHVRELFTNSVQIRMRSDVRVGSCLSGGIDSSSIVCTVAEHKLSNSDFATITSCFEDKRYDEQQFSDIVSKSTGIAAVKTFPNLDHLWTEGDLDKILYHQDQPIATASHYSEFSVFKKAKEQHMIVMLDGQGSDEYLCGYGEFFIVRIRELIRKLNFGSAIRLLKSKAAHNNVSFSKQLNTFIRTAYIFNVQKLVKKIIGKKEHAYLSKEWEKISRQNAIDPERNNIRDLSIQEIQHSSIPYQLHSEDRNSMLFSIESRLPFLDHRLVEYIIGLPSSFKIREGYTKAILRDAITELPDAIKFRKDKMGFVAPDAQWIIQNKEKVRAELKEIIDQTGIFTNELLERYDKFINGRLGYEPVYFRALTYSRFCKIFKMSVQ